MFEHIIQMGPMLIIAGLAAGWVAETLARAEHSGFIRDMVLGLIGSVVVGATFWVTISSEVGMLAMFLIGCGGAALALVAQRMFWRFASQDDPSFARSGG
jgi:uncharacterized membrane protein YeaQ/YmgE (transglycosylase-associated protein family)